MIFLVVVFHIVFPKPWCCDSSVLTPHQNLECICIDTHVRFWEGLKSFKYQIHIQWVRNCYHLPNVFLMGLFDEDIESSFFQGIFVFVREGPITGFDKIMIKSSVWVLRRIDSNNGEVQVVNGASGDRGGNRILLPLLVRLSNQVSCCSKTTANNQEPDNFCRLGLWKKEWKVLKKGVTYLCSRYIC